MRQAQLVAPEWDGPHKRWHAAAAGRASCPLMPAARSSFIQCRAVLPQANPGIVPKRPRRALQCQSGSMAGMASAITSPAASSWSSRGAAGDQLHAQRAFADEAGRHREVRQPHQEQSKLRRLRLDDLAEPLEALGIRLVGEGQCAGDRHQRYGMLLEEQVPVSKEAGPRRQDILEAGNVGEGAESRHAITTRTGPLGEAQCPTPPGGDGLSARPAASAR